MVSCQKPYNPRQIADVVNYDLVKAGGMPTQNWHIFQKDIAISEDKRNVN
ncbi:hypothetical protein KUL106_15280 [Alteromonas sp. KUL106]|nr:hypothetical protein KUL106_15280 [Alteromonas sp. KUL106]